MSLQFSDIVALAKQGYKPSDIKDLIALSSQTDPEPKQEPENETGQPEDPEQKTVEIDDQQKGEGESAPDNNEDLDYKKLYEDEKEKTGKLQKLITSADMSDKDNKESDLDIFTAVMKDFM